MNADFIKKLLIPQETKKLYPLKERVKENVFKKRKELQDIFFNVSKRIVLIIGPCSADNEKAVLEYYFKLKEIQDKVKQKIMIVPRLYTSKPRSFTKDYKGLLHQPNPEESEDLFNGICAMRSLFIKASEETEFIFADEMLYPENYRYIDDIIGYVVVGTRSVENQFHRLVSSAVDTPVGFKNPPDGNFDILLNAIESAQNQYDFIYRGWQVHSNGNNCSHAILRGQRDKNGNDIPNYNYDNLLIFVNNYNNKNIKNKGFIVDTNHSNSSKNPFLQKEIIDDVLISCKKNTSIKNLFRGFLVESYLKDGKNKKGEKDYGKSITDPCLGWDKTVELIDFLYKNI